MKNVIAILSIVCLCGCKDRFSTKPVTTVPGDKVTKTITETTKVERPVLVYRIVPSITTQTKTFTNDGNAAAPLHEATVKPLLQDAKQ